MTEKITEKDSKYDHLEKMSISALLNNGDYFSEATKSTIIETLEEKEIRNFEVFRFINTTLVNEYFYQRAA